MDEIYILIPSLDPDEKLIEVVSSLKKCGFNNILIVDDGSLNKDFFIKAQDEFSCKILTHSTNKGKGCALKTGFSYILSQQNDTIKGIVTVDGDNQHKASDVLLVSHKLCDLNDTLVLGVRQFKGVENVPLRSRLGNKMSAFIFQILSGENIDDTQTGLRGIPISHIQKFINIEGERFEYEMNVLLQLRKLNLKLIQVPIKTVYLDKNESSHFKPINDSIRVFACIFKFAIVGIISFFIDYLLFGLLIWFFKGELIFLSSVIARILSSLVNFSLNYKVVFKSNENKSITLLKYYTLAIVQMFLSSSGVSFGSLIYNYPLIIKPVVDLFLFLLSYYVQKKIIFKNKGDNIDEEKT